MTTVAGTADGAGGGTTGGMPPVRWLRRCAGAATDLLWGSVCVGCGEPGRALCAECAEPLRAGASVRVGGELVVYSAAPYEGGVAAAIPAFKERGRRDLIGALADGLAEAIDAVVVDAFGGSRAGHRARIWLVPVASSRAARRARGFVPVVVLARRAARRLRRVGGPDGLDVRLVAGVLEHVRDVSDQSELGQVDRRANLAGAIACTPGRLLDALTSAVARGELVVLVDDIVTTGATLAECQRALANTGVDVHAAAVVADTPLHHPRT